MTLASRNKILWSGLFLSLLIFITALKLLSLLPAKPEPSPSLFSGTSYWWYFSSQNVNITFLYWAAAASLILILSAVILTSFILFLFRRTASPEIFFFNLFILTLATNGLRILHLFWIQENASFYLGILLSRGMVFSYSFAILSLFAASLFSAGLPNQRLSLFLLVLVAVSLAFSTLIPIETTRLNTNLLYLPTGNVPAGAIFIALELMSILNYLRAGFLYSNRDYLSLAAGTAFSAAGYELLFFLGSPLLISLGYGFLLAGAFLFIKRIYTIYLWL